VLDCSVVGRFLQRLARLGHDAVITNFRLASLLLHVFGKLLVPVGQTPFFLGLTHDGNDPDRRAGQDDHGHRPLDSLRAHPDLGVAVPPLQDISGRAVLVVVVIVIVPLFSNGNACVENKVPEEPFGFVPDAPLVERWSAVAARVNCILLVHGVQRPVRLPLCSTKSSSLAGTFLPALLHGVDIVAKAIHQHARAPTQLRASHI